METLKFDHPGSYIAKQVPRRVPFLWDAFIFSPLKIKKMGAVSFLQHPIKIKVVPLGEVVDCGLLPLKDITFDGRCLG